MRMFRLVKNKVIKKYLVFLIVALLVFTLLPSKYNQENKVLAEDSATDVVEQAATEKEKMERSEIISMRTEESKTYLNENDTYTVEVAEKPIHFKDENKKEWQTIDNTLVPDLSGEAFVNKANSLVTEFSQEAAENKELVSIQEGENSITLSPVGASTTLPSSIQNDFTPVEGITEENEMLYPDVYPHTDLKYTVGTDRIKEDLILKEKPSSETPVTYSFKLDLEGLAYEEQRDGRILFISTETTKPVFYLEKPFMYDSFKPQGYKANSDAASFAEGSLSYEVEMNIVERDNQYYVDIIPNKEWLDSEERVYPVVIDPTIVKLQGQSKIQDTNIRSHFPNNTGGGETTLGVGLYQDASQTNNIRSLLKFDLTSIPVGAKVLDASMNLRLASVWNDTSIQVDLHEVTNSWTEAGATWAKKDGVNSWTKSGGDYVSAPLVSVGGIGRLTDMSINYLWNIPSQKIENQINNPSKNLGLLLKANNETVKSWKKFISSEDVANSEYAPLLAVTYASDSRTGHEPYWTYDQHEVAGGNLSVNVGTGNGVAQFTDFTIQGRGNSEISFDRFYNTKSAETDRLGPGWSFTGSESITENNSTLYYTDIDGTTHDFVYNTTTKKYVGPAGTYLDIVKVAGTTIHDDLKLTDKFGNVSVYQKRPYDDETSANVYKLSYQLDRNGNKIQYAYNDQGNITGITDASGRKMTITQGSGGISSVVFDNKKYTYHYTGGRLSEVREFTDATNYLSTHYGYDTNGRLDRITDPNGNVTRITYQNELVQTVQQPSPSGASLAVTTYQFDILKRTSELTDPNGGINKFVLNSNYGVKSSTNPLGKIMSQDAMDANFNTTQATDAEGNITKSLFDPKGNLLNATDAKGIMSTNTYDSFSSLKTATNPKGTTGLDYDPKGNLEKLTEADGNITSQAYDIYGNPKSTTASDGTQQIYAFDTAGNYQTGSTDQIGRIVQAQSDAFGNIRNRTDAKGNITSYDYDQRLLLREVTDAKGGNSPYDYDGNQNLLSVINALGKKTSYSYNGQNQLKTRTLPMGEVISFDYDHNGNLVGLNQPTGTIIKNEYDKANQLLWIFVDGVKRWGFTYDGNGNVKTVTDAATAQVKSNDYDKNGNLDLESKGTTSIDYGYSDANELNSISGKSNAITFTQTFDFNEVGRIKTIKRNGANLVTFDYKPVGLPSYVLYSNGIQTDFGFDKAQQLETLSVKKGATSLLTESFKYDENGNINTVTSSSGNRAYTYDELNQLKSQTLADGTIESYEYDRVGNRLEKKSTVNGQTATTTYGHNDNNQLTSVNGVSFAYDANGNRTKDTRFSYHYNKFDELESVKTLSGQLVATYEYDEQGRRITKTINGVKTNYHYGQGIEVLFETNAAGDITAEYTYDQRGFPKTLTKNGQTYFYVLNGHFDVVALTDASGQTVASYSYDAWGNILSQSGAMAKENPYRYAGYRYDEETKHYYLIVRYYNANEGVFLSSDPVAGEAENPQSQNGYSYAENNPVMNYDPNGNFAIALPVVGLAFGVAAASYAAYQTGVLIGNQAQALYAAKKKKMHDTSDGENSEETAGEIIAREKKGKIHGEFPSELKGKTLKELKALDKQGNAGAKKALKLLTDHRFDKGDNRK